MTKTYEDLLKLAHRLRPANSNDDRSIEWCDGAGPVGLSRDPKGRIEIFLEGPELPARYPRVRAALEHQVWYRSEGEELLASRILLPAAGHYEQVAAFLCTELLRAGAQSDLAGAFATTEALIEMAITDLVLADRAIAGLCGELLLLRSLLEFAPDAFASALLDSWKGYRDTARDFQIGRVGVEVKTTTGSASSHRFSGVHQLEIGHGVDGEEESEFFVVSIGIEWTTGGEGSTTLPDVVEGLLTRIDQALGTSAQAYREQLIAQIASYGSPTTIGYDHRSMASVSRFRRPFKLQFTRCYDMLDDAIRLLTTDDLRNRPFIDADSVHLRINLPSRVRGDLNPVTGLASTAESLIRNQ
jgi:hypothetical protein